MRDCGVCRARRSRGGLFPLAYSPSKAIGRNSQKSGIPTEILKISVFGLSCVRAIVYAKVIRSAPQKSPPPFLDFTTPFTTPFFRGPWPSMETSLQADRKIRGRGLLSKTQELTNCDEFAPPYRGKNWYWGANSSQLAQLPGFGYDPPSSYLAIKVEGGHDVDVNIKLPLFW